MYRIYLGIRLHTIDDQIPSRADMLLSTSLQSATGRDVCEPLILQRLSVSVIPKSEAMLLFIKLSGCVKHMLKFRL